MGTSLKVVPVAHRGFRPPSESQNPDIESLWDEPLFAALICSVGQNGTTMNNDVPTPEPTGSRPGDGHSGPAIPDITPGHSGPTHGSNPGLPLRRLLMSLGDPVVDVAAAPDGVTQGHQEAARSEEHTSELQSRFELVCRLLLEK